MIEISDQELVQNALSGKSSGYAAIIDRYQSLVFSLSMRYVQNREIAEELSQDVFMKAFRALPNFRFESKFSSWLFRIVYTTCISYLRLAKLKTEELGESHYNLFAEEGDISLNYDAKIRKKSVHRALNLLSQEDSSLLYLYYMLEQSLKEIGEIISVPEDTVKVRLYRARQKFKNVLIKNAEYGIYEQ